MLLFYRIKSAEKEKFMLKKSLTTLSITFCLLGLSTYSFADKTTQKNENKTQIVKENKQKNNFVFKNPYISPNTKKNLDEIKKTNPKWFENESLSKEDQQVENILIKNVKKKYFDKKTLTKKEMFQLYTYYVDFIMQGFNKAAESIWNYSQENKNFNINVNYYNKHGISPLIAAAISRLNGGNVEYAIKLIKRGANPNQVTPKENISVLSLAATKDNYKVLAVLLASGANFMKKDNYGFIPYDYAEKHHSTKSLFILSKVMLGLKKDFIKNYESGK